MFTEIDIDKVCIEGKCSILDAVTLMNHKHLGIVLVVDSNRKLLGTITDGDVRRALLAKMDLNQSVMKLLDTKVGSRFESPVAALVGQSDAVYLEVMKKHKIYHLPLVDEAGCVARLVTLNDLVPDRLLPVKAVVMAGGKGTRLRPLTENLPKPMLPVGDQPLLELIIEQLREAGIHRVNVTTHYKPEKITEYFGDGSTFGVELNYVSEGQPLGTAGALGLMDVPQEPVLLINGDVLTQVDFRAMLIYHQEHGAEITVAVRKYDLEVPYGVIECEGPIVRRLKEKPLMSFFVNAGIYLLQPSVYNYITNGEHLDMTDLIQRLLDAGRSVVSFPVLEYWMDIGQLEDYEQAQQDIKEFKSQRDSRGGRL